MSTYPNPPFFPGLVRAFLRVAAAFFFSFFFKGLHEDTMPVKVLWKSPANPSWVQPGGCQGPPNSFSLLVPGVLARVRSVGG